jgi:hypothetical protein
MIARDPKDSALGLTTKYGLDYANELGRDVGYGQELRRELCVQNTDIFML